MSTNPWAKHYQLPWEERVANRQLPLWLRVACLAYGRHEPNGHAMFGRGELAWILGTPPKDGEPFKRVDRTQIRDAIRLAVKHEWLAEGSCSECLVVPGHAIEMPIPGQFKTCPVHERKRSQKQAQTTLQVVAS